MTEPHSDHPLHTAGAPLEDASVAVVMIHGRGARADGFLQFADEIDVDGIAYLAPQADRGSWYPNRFIDPIESNEPHLSAALGVVEETIAKAVDAGIDHDHVVLMGFSQGACLASEYVARNPREYGGLVAFSGGLIGPLGMSFEHEGDVAGTPVFFGCSDSDPHIPEERVTESADVFERLGASVEVRIYPDMGHTIIDDEVEYVVDLLEDLVDSG
jgi:phospholipase/carboxylesterase